MTSLTQAEQATNAETWSHIDLVSRFLSSAQIELMRRQFTHDRTKLRPPEVSTFTEFTPKLKTSTYGSPEYQGFLTSMADAIDHHYRHNRHHPEFFPEFPADPQIRSHIVMANHALKNGCVLPDDPYGYQQLIDFLERKQHESTAAVNQMNLFDLLEMFLDWNAAVQRHDDGDIRKSIEINTDRFKLSPQLVQIFINTIPWVKDEFAALETQADLV
jgi:Family of unknown function (DUF5662)